MKQFIMHLQLKNLKTFLSDSSNIVTAMVQKFQESANENEFPVLNESEKIIVLADETSNTIRNIGCGN